MKKEVKKETKAEKEIEINEELEKAPPKIMKPIEMENRTKDKKNRDKKERKHKKHKKEDGFVDKLREKMKTIIFDKDTVIEDDRVQVWRKKETLEYEAELQQLQIELLKMQNHLKDKGLKLLVIFEGRDAAGKGGTIRRITEHLNPRGLRVVALEKPSDVERTQWYFQRYVEHLPSAGEIVLMDRSWYNRAGVEPVMGFCTQQQQMEFLEKVPKFENMIISDKVILVKFYLSISKDEQAKRFKKRKTDPLKQYKLSPVDQLAQDYWDKYTIAKFSMLMASHNKSAPWYIVRSDDKKRARLNVIKKILQRIEYPNKIDEGYLETNPEILLDGDTEISLMSEQNAFHRKND
jgi:polyphosphate kinase 2